MGLLGNSGGGNPGLPSVISSPTFTGTVTSTGNIVPAADQTYDLGSAALGWQAVYLAGVALYSTADGVLRLSNAAGNDFSRLMFGGNTSSFPAFKRTTTQIQARLADDSAFTSLASSAFAQSGANGQSCTIQQLSELTTIAAAATTDTTIQMPANAVVLGVSVRVTTVIPTAATFTVGDSGSAARFNTAAVSTAANSTDPGTKAGAYYNASALAIRITPNLTPADNTGRVRVTIHYYEITPPTS